MQQRSEDLLEERGKLSSDLLAQLSITPLAPSFRDKVLRELDKELETKGIRNDLRISKGGLRTIDITSSNASKFNVLDDEQKSGGWYFLYFGAEFRLQVGPDGQVARGSDMDMLAIPNLLTFAHNLDQDEVRALKNPDRIVAAGSGPNATWVWLNHLAENLRLRI